MNTPIYVVAKEKGKRKNSLKCLLMTTDGVYAKTLFDLESTKLLSGNLHLVKIEKCIRLNFAAAVIQRKK